MKSIIVSIITILFVVLVLAFSLRGKEGTPEAAVLRSDEWSLSGPFELSPERGRFALTYSMVEDRSVFFSVDIARFVVPDLGYARGNYVSLFAPGVSLLILPGYLIGKVFGIAQVGAFAAISVFAILNFILIRLISKKLGASEASSILTSLVFLFASPAFAYGVNLYQHHISTFMVLFGIYLLMGSKRQWLRLFLIWFLCAVSIVIDYPNLFLMLPIGFAALLRLVEIRETQTLLKFKLNLARFFTFTAVLIPLAIFMTFSYLSYGNPLQFSGTIAGVKAIDENGRPTSGRGEDFQNVAKFVNPERQEKSSLNFFKPRDIVNGLYIHLFSPDRGVITYTPVILLGLIGFYLLYKSHNNFGLIFGSIVAINIILYSMWGDPWGGWAFGSRYLIPSYAVMAIFLSVALTRFSKNKIFLLLFSLVMIYSISVNTLGAITTSAIPPKVEAIALEQLSGKQERYSFDRNWEHLNTSGSKSFIYNLVASKYMSPVAYYLVLVSLISVFSLGYVVAVYFKK